MLEEVKAAIAMLVVQFIFAGMFILFKITAHDGTNLRILVAYRLSFATLFMFPLALIFQRKKRPEFTRRLVLLAFLSGLLGAAIPNILYLPGLVRTSATFSTAASILSPVITLVLSLAFRMDTLRLGSNEGRAKLLGTLLGVGGALVFVFYKGFELHIWSTHVDLLKSSGQSSGPATENHHHISISGGVVVSGLVMPLVAWCIEKKGPLYVTVFSPIRLVIVALVGSFALEETLYLGSLIGAIIMVGGVYLVVWCKMKEKKSVSTTTDHVETNKNIKEVSLGNLSAVNNRDVP
uniref:WAT1-related protein n=1 Tax=Brassica campestris TaxID=3711 RepID=M4D7M8_BRACM